MEAGCLLDHLSCDIYKLGIGLKRVFDDWDKMEEQIKEIAVNMINVFTNLNIVSMGYTFKISS